MFDADEAVTEFLIESHENLDQLDRDFVVLETDPSAHERIATIFRTIHTIKGAAGFLGYTRLEALTHGGESLLSRLRDGQLKLTPEITSALLAMVDRVREMLKSIEATGAEGDVRYEDALTRLTELQQMGSLPAQNSPPAVASEPERIQLWSMSPAEPSNVDPQARPSIVHQGGPALEVEHGETDNEPYATQANAPPPSAPPPPQPHYANAPQPALPATNAVTDTTVRVDVGLLDILMNLVGELVLARNQILQFGAQLEDAGFVSASQRLNHITTELQEHVMKTRMQPIGNIWAKLPRVVRDLAVACGKQLRIEMLGKETELDRTILEAIKDPLTHIVRNSVDHGVEAPDERAARGKPRTGTLTLRAFHEGGQVNIEISDDGAGLKLDAIRKKAIERNLIAADRAGRLTDHEIMQLVFEPGFSTAPKVTNVSGRGVGMDVVKTNVEKIGGTVDLTSKEGAGTTLKIKIPLTLAIVPALIVSSAGERYAIPQVNLLELVRLEGEQASRAIERVHGTPVYRLRGRLLPLVFLSEQLGRGGRSPAFKVGVPSTDGASNTGSVSIVVLQADERQFGLVVDDVRDTEEIVVKPLGKELKGITVFQGATIMGDGRVAMILDILGLAQHSGVVNRVREQAAKDAGQRRENASADARSDARQALLLFSVGTSSVMALPLSMVARIEEFPSDRVELAGSRKVVQYRDEIMPLIELAEVLGSGGVSDRTAMNVIVYSERGRSVGFVVKAILDVVEDAVRVERCTVQRGLLGAAVIQGKVTDLLDVEGVIRTHYPSFFEGRAA